MQIALVGTGQMGQAVARLADERGDAVVSRFDSDRPLTAAEPADLVGADVAIDFSLPAVALDHLERYCRWQQPAVVGTTGWYDDLDRVRGWVEEHEATLLYAPNFSLGVALLVRALRGVLPLLDDLEAFDAAVHEWHHTRKMDSPSGTARMLGEVLRDGLTRKTHLATEAQHERIDPAALHVSSTRVGHVYGEHVVSIDGPFDHVQLAHRAKGREGFAYGALHAARWLLDQPPGLYTLDDVLG